MPPAAVLKRLALRRFPAASAFCIALALTVGVAALARTAQGASNADLAGMLKGGGYNLYVRHAATDWSQSDNIEAHGDWKSCDPGEVRQLSDKGRRQARAVGEALRALGIRLGKVFASPYCRTMETARLISQKDVEATVDLMNLRAAAYVGGRDAVVARARKRLSQPPAAGVNDLFAAHGNLGRAALGESLSEGEVLVIEPRGEDRFETLGTLTLENLKALAGSAPRSD